MVLLFIFPLLWWMLVLFKPYTAVFNSPPIYTDFAPTTDSMIVAVSATALAVFLVTLVAYDHFRFTFRSKDQMFSGHDEQGMEGLVTCRIWWTTCWRRWW